MIVSLSRTSGRPDRWLVSRSKFSATFFFSLSQNCLNTWQMHIVLITMPEMSFFWANEPQAIFFGGAFRSKVADPVRSWKSSEMPFAGKKCARLTSMDTSQCSFNSFNCFPFNWITILWNLLRAVLHRDHRPLRPVFTCSRSTWRSVANLLRYDLL